MGPSALKRSQGRAPAAAGLTLVETVVALAILAILLALAFSGLGLVNNRRLASSARVLASEMRDVGQRARTERRCWRIVFDPVEERYEVHVLETGGTDTRAGCQPGRGGRWQSHKSAVLPRPVDLVRSTFPSDRPVISPFGNLAAGEVVLRVPNGPQRVVAITALGRVTIAP